jgi:integrase
MEDGLKPSNTRQQKEATYRLFAGWFSDKPLRDIRRSDASKFMDALRTLDPAWARSSSSVGMSWGELHGRYGGHAKGLAASTLNRHAMTLQELWRWGEDRGRCSGNSPFSGLRQRIKPGKNMKGYLPWETEELLQLFSPPPRRRDVTEIMVVALHSGMRINEIASLTYGHIRLNEGVRYFQIEDAKTEAGNRQVPLHSALSWLTDRKGLPDERVWPQFNPEGPGKKPGADAGKEFSRFKLAKGFIGGRKVFHSFRKNVTRIMERAGVLENEWAQVFGHERGYTYTTYNPDGITLQRKLDLIELIAYPEVTFPDMSAGT